MRQVVSAQVTPSFVRTPLTPRPFRAAQGSSTLRREARLPYCPLL